MPEPILIKKYTNRRLYNTQESAYITLEQLAELIREGAFVEVQDAKSGADVTDFILTQIVLEKSRQKEALLPAPLLHLIIRHGDTMLEEFFNRYLEQIINSYLTYKNSMETQFRHWVDVSMNMPGQPPPAWPGFGPFPVQSDETTEK